MPISFYNSPSTSMSAFVTTKTLPSGHRIPAVALGVFQSKPGAEVYNAALNFGYRHIDTASGYENEFDVGRAVASHAKNLRHNQVLRSVVGAVDQNSQPTMELSEGRQRCARKQQEASTGIHRPVSPARSVRCCHPRRCMEGPRRHAGPRSRARHRRVQLW